MEQSAFFVLAVKMIVYISFFGPNQGNYCFVMILNESIQ